MKQTSTTLIINALLLTLLYSCSSRPTNDFKYDPILISAVWHVHELAGYTLSNDTLKLSFDNINNRISGYTGCNKLTGSFAIKDGRLVLSPTTATRFMCLEKSTLETEYLKQLAKSDSLDLADDVLKLFSKSQLTMVFWKD